MQDLFTRKGIVLKKIEIDNDRPIEFAVDDLIQRKQVSKRLFTILESKEKIESLTVGIFGPWGSGKTSVLNMLSEELDKSNKYLVCHFDPWNYSNEANIYSAFIQELKSCINDNDIGDNLLEYLSLVQSWNAIPEKIGKCINIVKKIFQLFYKQKPIKEVIDSLNDKLLNLDRKVVVIIDDIDRLSFDKIRDIFQMINKIFNLNNITYFISVDKKVACSSLENIQGNGISGEEYLEKIVQLEVNIENPTKSEVMTILEDKLKDLMGKYNFEVKLNERIAEIDCWITPVKLNIRDVKRITNLMDYKLSIFGTDVDFIDLLIMTLIETKYAKLYEFIVENYLMLVEPQMFGYSDKDHDFIVENISKLTNFSKPEVDVLIGGIFPHYLGNSQKQYIECSNYKIGTRANFESYVNIKEKEQIASKQSVKRFLNDCIGSSTEKIIMSLIESGLISDFVDKLNEEVLTNEQKLNVSKLFIKNINHLSNNSSNMFTLSDKEKVVLFCLKEINDLPNRDLELFAKELLEEHYFVNASRVYYYLYTNSVKDSSNKIYENIKLDKMVAEQLIDNIIDNLKKRIINNAMFEITDLPFYLKIWAETKPEEYKKIMMEYVKSSNLNIIKYACLFSSKWTGTNGIGYSFDNDGFRNCGLEVSEIILAFNKCMEDKEKISDSEMIKMVSLVKWSKDNDVEENVDSIKRYIREEYSMEI